MHNGREPPVDARPTCRRGERRPCSSQPSSGCRCVRRRVSRPRDTQGLLCEASGAPGESARDPTLAGCAASGEAPEVPATAAEVKNRGVHPRDGEVQLRYSAAGDNRSAASSLGLEMEKFKSRCQCITTCRTCSTFYGELKYIYMWLGSMAACAYTGVTKSKYGHMQHTRSGYS